MNDSLELDTADLLKALEVENTALLSAHQSNILNSDASSARREVTQSIPVHSPASVSSSEAVGRQGNLHSSTLTGGDINDIIPVQPLCSPTLTGCEVSAQSEESSDVQASEALDETLTPNSPLRDSLSQTDKLTHSNETFREDTSVKPLGSPVDSKGQDTEGVSNSGLSEAALKRLHPQALQDKWDERASSSKSSRPSSHRNEVKGIPIWLAGHQKGQYTHRSDYHRNFLVRVCLD